MGLLIKLCVGGTGFGYLESSLEPLRCHVLYTLSEVWLKHGVGLTFMKTIKLAM